MVAVLSSMMACINWPSDEDIRRSRCTPTQTDEDCVAVDSGVIYSGVIDSGVDSGVVDSGVVDSGVDSGVDAGSWAPSWVNSFYYGPLFLVCGGDAGTLSVTPLRGPFCFTCRA